MFDESLSQASVRCCITYSDGAKGIRKVVAWYEDGALVLWDTASETGKQLGNSLTAGCTLLNGRTDRLLSWSDAGDIRVWDLQNCRQLEEYRRIIPEVFDSPEQLTMLQASAECGDLPVMAHTDEVRMLPS
jgi:hypothetical protein